MPGKCRSECISANSRNPLPMRTIRRRSRRSKKTPPPQTGMPLLGNLAQLRPTGLLSGLDGDTMLILAMMVMLYERRRLGRLRQEIANGSGVFAHIKGEERWKKWYSGESGLCWEICMLCYYLRRKRKILSMLAGVGSGFLALLLVHYGWGILRIFSRIESAASGTGRGAGRAGGDPHGSAALYALKATKKRGHLTWRCPRLL